jgi:hypothetical protein
LIRRDQKACNRVEEEGREGGDQAEWDEEKPTQGMAKRLARNPMRLRPLIDRGWTLFSEKDGLSKIKPWTDDYINILAPLIERMKSGAV